MDAKSKLNRAMKAHTMNNKPVQYTHDAHSTDSLFEQVVSRLTAALDDVKSAVDETGVMHIQRLANTLVNGDIGLKLFECNEMQICLLANGDLADSATPFNRGSVLVPRTPRSASPKSVIADHP